MSGLIGVINWQLKDDWMAHRAGYLTKLEGKMSELLPGTDLRSNPHIESKLKIWRNHYNCVTAMLATSGFGRNDSCNTVEVESDSVWEAYVKVNKKLNFQV